MKAGWITVLILAIVVVAMSVYAERGRLRFIEEVEEPAIELTWPEPGPDTGWLTPLNRSLGAVDTDVTYALGGRALVTFHFQAWRDICEALEREEK